MELFDRIKTKMKINNQIVAEAGRYVSDHMEKYLSKDFCYHDFFHTFSVVNGVDILCDANGLNKTEKRILLTAAWFHDTGYTKKIDGHEEHGALLAEAFLKNQNVDEEEIEQVKACVLATLYPQQPTNILEQIICDADMLHVSEPNFMERSKLLRNEWEATKSKSFSDKEWYELNIDFLNKHSFHTDYCREQFNKPKSKNLNALMTKLEQLNLSSATNGKENKITAADIEKKKKEKKPQLERGVETLFRMTSGNHMKLSGMADDKAHILLSINSIIISVVLSLLAKYLDRMPYLILPMILLLSVCLITIVFAVLTTKPKVSKGVFTAEQIHSRQANLLFFGNFHKMGWESYEWGIQEIMYDKEYLYKSMTKDIYFLGKVLAAKYKYLNIGYKVFMYGLIASVIAFGVSFFLAH
jgi:predicted metal-dependent HD superfamily phosphohydrolase